MEGPEGGRAAGAGGFGLTNGRVERQIGSRDWTGLSRGRGVGEEAEP